MSTTNLREVVSYFAAEASGPDSPRARKAAAAWGELMSIERAAKWMVSADQDPAKAVEHMSLMESIAKDAK